MLTEIYIEALLVDEELADQVWEKWINGHLSALDAAVLWYLIVDCVNGMLLFGSGNLWR